MGSRGKSGSSARAGDGGGKCHQAGVGGSAYQRVSTRERWMKKCVREVRRTRIQKRSGSTMPAVNAANKKEKRKLYPTSLVTESIDFRLSDEADPTERM